MKLKLVCGENPAGSLVLGCRLLKLMMACSAAEPELKILAVSHGRLEGSGRGLRQPRSHVLSVWRLFPKIEAERFGFVAGIFCGNRLLVGSFTGGSAVTARHAACGGTTFPRFLALKRGKRGGRYRLPFPILHLAP